MTLGEKIAKLRKQKDWTQDQFAAKLGVHGRHISRWETDRIKPPMKRLRQIADLFNTSVEAMVRDDELEPVIEDRELMRQCKQMEELTEEEKTIIITLIQALVTKRRMEKLLRPGG